MPTWPDSGGVRRSCRAVPDRRGVMLVGVTLHAPPIRRIHPAWWVAAVTFLALVGAAAFRAVPGVLIDPLHAEFGWSVSTVSAAVAVNMALYGLTAPFAAALMERFGIRRVVVIALLVTATGSGLTVFMQASWQLVLLWGVLVGLGTGSMALSLVATVTGRWFVARRGLVSGILTAGGSNGQLVFLPLVAWIDQRWGWRPAALGTAAAALAVLPLVAWLLRDRPRDVGVVPYGGGGGRRPPAGRRRPLRREGGRRPRAGAHGRGAQRAAGPGRGRAVAGLLAAHGRVLPLRGVDQRADPAALHPRRARPRPAGDHGGVPAGGRRTLRPGRHRALRLAHRPGGSAGAAAGLLRAPRLLAVPAAAAVRPRPARQHARVHRLLRAGLGGHGAADDGAVPGALRRSLGGGVP